jgi:hypothetical protein
MFWNVENLFDDQDDRRNSVDNPYDDWFAQDAEARNLKYAHLAQIILKANDGKGPDLLACCEVESVRAAELLRDTLNTKLPPGAVQYEHVVMKELAANAGRYMTSPGPGCSAGTTCGCSGPTSSPTGRTCA